MPEQKTLTTTVQGIGKPKSQKGFALTLAHTWPSSKFPTVLYGQDEEQVKGLAPGDAVAVLVQKGNLKQGKDPKYETSYFWDMVSITKAGGGATAPASATQPAGAAPRTFPAPKSPYAPPALSSDDRKNISIERQKAVAETVVLVVGAYKAWLTVGGDKDLGVFLGEHVPILAASVRKSAPTLYASIHGTRETREVADPDAAGNEPQ